MTGGTVFDGELTFVAPIAAIRDSTAVVVTDM